jgi:hypothetical protein
MDFFINNYKHIIGGINNRSDLDKIIEIMKINETEKTLIINYFNSLNKNLTLSYDDFNNLIIELNKFKYKEEILEYLYKYTLKITCPIQKNCLICLIKQKQNKPIYFNTKDIKERTGKELIKKKCPHCSHENSIKYDTNYIICGYNDLSYGYDWEGCGRDWCGQCGKRLCKKWSDNELFLEENRFHDSDCCFVNAKQIDLNYYLDFCQCNNNIVKRII